MEAQMKLRLRIFEVKDFNHFVVREEDTIEAKRYKKLEKVLQNTYNTCDNHNNEDNCKPFKVGSYVAAYIEPFSHKSPQLWLRGIIKNISGNGLNYLILLADIGIERCFHKSLLRELMGHFGPDFVSFQTLNFHLSGIEHKNEVQTNLVIDYIKWLFSLNKKVVIANIIRRDKAFIFGDILLENNCDLASILIHKQLVNEKFNNCKHLRSNSIHENKEECDQSLLPNCKCYAIIQYRRKLLTDLLQESEKVENNKREHTFSQYSPQNACHFEIQQKNENELENRFKCSDYKSSRSQLSRSSVNKTI